MLFAQYPFFAFSQDFSEDEASAFYTVRETACCVLGHRYASGMRYFWRRLTTSAILW